MHFANMIAPHWSEQRKKNLNFIVSNTNETAKGASVHRFFFPNKKMPCHLVFTRRNQSFEKIFKCS